MNKEPNLDRTQGLLARRVLSIALSLAAFVIACKQIADMVSAILFAAYHHEAAQTFIDPFDRIGWWMVVGALMMASHVAWPRKQ